MLNTIPEINLPVNITPILNGGFIWILVKIALTILLLIYLVFALVIVKQARIMTETLEIGFETPIKIISYLHFLFALGILVYVLVIV